MKDPAALHNSKGYQLFFGALLVLVLIFGGIVKLVDSFNAKEAEETITQNSNLLDNFSVDESRYYLAVMSAFNGRPDIENMKFIDSFTDQLGDFTPMQEYNFTGKLTLFMKYKTSLDLGDQEAIDAMKLIYTTVKNDELNQFSKHGLSNKGFFEKDYSSDFRELQNMCRDDYTYFMSIYSWRTDSRYESLTSEKLGNLIGKSWASFKSKTRYADHPKEGFIMPDGSWQRPIHEEFSDIYSILRTAK